MERKRVLCLLATAIVAVIPCSAHAALGSAVTVLDLHLVDGDQPSFIAGELFLLNPTVSVPPGLQVRFFCATKDDLLRQPHRVSADHRCWTYDSSVWKPSASDGQLRFGKIPFEWAIGPGGKGHDQVYFLVFEDGDLPDGPIQIVKDQVPVYFNSGQQILIQAPPNAGDLAAPGTGTRMRASAGRPGVAWILGGTAAGAEGTQTPPPPICLEVAEIRQGAVRFAAAKGCAGASRGQPAAASSPWQRLMREWGELFGRGH
jgi:hypothetical protein